MSLSYQVWSTPLFVRKKMYCLAKLHRSRSYSVGSSKDTFVSTLKKGTWIRATDLIVNKVSISKAVDARPVIYQVFSRPGICINNSLPSLNKKTSHHSSSRVTNCWGGRLDNLIMLPITILHHNTLCCSFFFKCNNHFNSKWFCMWQQKAPMLVCELH